MYTWGGKPPFFAWMKNFGPDTGGIAPALL